MKRLCYILLVLLCAGPASALVTDTLKGTTETYDLTIRQANPTYNYGGTTTLTINATAGQQRRIIFYPTDLSAVIESLGDSGIVSAKLQLYCEGYNDTCIISAYELAHPVKEGNANHAEASSNTTTWGHWNYSDTAWSVEGANRSGTIGTTYPYTRGDWRFFAPGARNPSANSGWATGGGNIYASDDSRGVLRTNLVANTGVAQGFGWTLPSGAVVDSIFYTVEGHLIGEGDFTGAYLQTRKAGSATGDQVGIATSVFGYTSANESVEEFGINRAHGGSDIPNPLWGGTWTSTDINSTTTGLHVVRPQNVDSFHVDHITMEVKYHADTTLDRGSAALSVDTVTGTGAYYEWIIDTAIVHAWQANTKAENGIILIETSAGQLTTFTSSEGTESQQPLLIIEYDPPDEPAGDLSTRRRRLLLQGGNE